MFTNRTSEINCSRRGFLRTVGFLVGTAACPGILKGADSGPKKPNFVVFMIDDLGYGDIGCYGGWTKTPNIDQLCPGKIKASQVSHEKVMTMDFFPTIARLAGAPLPTRQKIDGLDISPLLMKDQRINERTLFWRKGNAKAVRKGPWKLVVKGDHIELYNLDDDLGEEKNLATEKPELVVKLTKALAKWEKEVESGFMINSK